MVRPKDSIALSKRKSQKAIVDFKQIRSTRKLVIGLILVCIFLSFAFTGYQLYDLIINSEVDVIKIMNTCIVFLYIIFLIFETNIIYFHLTKHVKISIIMDIAFNLSFLTLTILQSVEYDQNVIDVRFILPLIIIIVLVLIFIFKGFIFYQGMYVLLKRVKNNISTALISQKSFNEKLLQSLIPDDTPNRDEQIQHSLDELEYISRQASDITPVNSQIKYKQNNNINF
ncbi:transmembrane protein, putative (macronuclear) [Tetrahymena thermophila SB210]|uniref:Transmembrane protein, putative n=1 Tax=Tetrahymena thermophila (strain SB210) TaxID=312017 RepID=I7M800_TETTS|nr:transmembrane protein, putative [Tetrahymena thermophila SB210]EAR96346.2 transmembrane protein, putative [Tetrahymena thermophila SB210]|eukprot:XP_001016591.2 transmembrane protein, putative [Tetrahymena thermophila SB210]